jgi:sugar lactone lactonase YvrE
MRYAALFLVLIIAIVAGLAFLPGPIDAAAFAAPPSLPMQNRLAPNDALKKAQRIAEGKVIGPEDVDMDSDGRLYSGTQDGKIIRVDASGEPKVFATTGGRPLGLHFDASGNLIVADAWKGLLSIDPQGVVTTLATEADGKAFQFTNALDIASDGKIYFTDSSRFHQPDWMLDAFEAKPWGRLLCYDPATKTTQTIMAGLNFPNGVALSQNEDFLIVNETFRYRTLRFWLKGGRTGTDGVFIDNLPGFPDGVSSNGQGVFWMAVPTVRNPMLDAIHPYPWLKNIVARLPKSLSPKPQPYGLIIAINEEGHILRSLHDTDGSVVSQVTSVKQRGDRLLLGNLEQQYMARLDMDTSAPPSKN